jgi:hypothetical protein
MAGKSSPATESDIGHLALQTRVVSGKVKKARTLVLANPGKVPAAYETRQDTGLLPYFLL